MLTRLKAIEELSSLEYISTLLEYLRILQDGRAKPDNTGSGGYVRESSYNIAEIAKVKEEINNFYRIRVAQDTLEFDTTPFKTRHNNEKYSK